MPINTWNPLPVGCGALLVLALLPTSAVAQSEPSQVVTAPTGDQPVDIPHPSQDVNTGMQEQFVGGGFSPGGYNAFANPVEFGRQPYQAPSGGYSGYASYQPQVPARRFSRPAPGWLYPQAQYSTFPAGLVLPISLDTTISPRSAKTGDYIQAHVSQNVTSGGTGYLPGGSVVTGSVSSSTGGRRGEHHGSLTIDFTRLRLPNGLLIPISAHLVGEISNYKSYGNGEGRGSGLLNLGLRTTASAGMGSILEMGVGSFSDGGRGLGSGCLSGLAMGAGVGALESLVWRHHREALIHSGTKMQMQLDDPVQLPTSSRGPGPGYQQRQGAR